MQRPWEEQTVRMIMQGQIKVTIKILSQCVGVDIDSDTQHLTFDMLPFEALGLAHVLKDAANLAAEDK